MKNDDVSIEKSVKNFRALVLFTNERSGSLSTIKWFWNSHKKYINYNQMIEAVESLGYTVNKSAESYDLFSEDGMFYDITKQWLETRNEKLLLLAIDTILSYRPTHRIILEKTHYKIIEKLVIYQNAYHASCIFLHRRNKLDRLLSLWYTEQANIKTVNDLLDFKPDKFTPDDLDINYLISNQKKIDEINLYAWSLLQKYKPRYVAISYEDFFESTQENILHIALRWLFYHVWDFSELISEGNLNLKEYYYKMKNIDILENELKKLPKTKYGNMHVEI